MNFLLIRAEARERHASVEMRVDLKIGDRVRVLERKGCSRRNGRYWSDTVPTIVASNTARCLVDGCLSIGASK